MEYDSLTMVAVRLNILENKILTFVYAYIFAKSL